MESSTKHIDAASEVDVPPRSWSRILSAAEVVAAELFPDSSVALRFVSDYSIQRLNRDFRAVNSATDVLSFPASDPGDRDDAAVGQRQSNVAIAEKHAGDIALSWETAQRQARTNGNSVEDECIALLAHGLLHLAGYEHESDEADAEMQRRTSELLRLVGVEIKVYGH